MELAHAAFVAAALSISTFIFEPLSLSFCAQFVRVSLQIQRTSEVTRFRCTSAKRALCVALRRHRCAPLHAMRVTQPTHAFDRDYARAMRTSIACLACLFLGCGPALTPARVWSSGGAVCTSAVHTEGAVPEGAASGCRMSVSMQDGIFEEAFRLGRCGPCAFIYDAAMTRAERASGRGDACCYRGESPPPPPH